MKQKISQTISATQQFNAVFKLIARYYLKSFYGPFFNFVFSPLILAILGSVMGYEIMIPGIMAMISVAIGIQLIPFAVMELKKSVLLKRIGASPVKPKTFTIVMLVFFFITIIVSTMWLALWGLVFTLDISIYSSFKSWESALGFIHGLLLNIALSLAFGFAIASISKSEMQAQAIGMIVYFPIAFLSGQFLSPDVIASNDVMQWISRFIPFRYTTMMMSQSWQGSVFDVTGNLISEANIWKIHDFAIFKPDNLTAHDWGRIIAQNGTINTTEGIAVLQEKISNAKFVLYDKADHIASFVYPYITILGMLYLSIRKFKWSATR